MTTAIVRHEVDLDSGPLGGRRRSYTPCCTCGWTSPETYKNASTAAEAAVAHARAEKASQTAARPGDPGGPLRVEQRTTRKSA